MALSIFLAQLMGIVFILTGVGMLLNVGYYRKALEKMVKEEGTMYMTGITLLTAGVAIVLTHNIWTSSWVVIVTIMGWATALKGFVILALPRWTVAMYEKLMKMANMLVMPASIACIVIGAFLAYYGFYA